MANVCQKCGAVGYADLLVYCSFCHKAAQHQYCLDTIPELDEDIRWACEGCNFGAIESNCFNESGSFENSQGVKILNNDTVRLSAKPNAYSLLDREKHVVSNEKSAIIRDNLCDKDSHVAHISPSGSESGSNLHMGDLHNLKAWGKTNKRVVRSKQAAKVYFDPLRNKDETSQAFERSNPNECDISMGGIEIKAWGKTNRRAIRSKKMTKAYLGPLRNEGETSQHSELGPNECDFLMGGIEKDSSLVVVHPFERSHPSNYKRKLILSDEDDVSLEGDTSQQFDENNLSVDGMGKDSPLQIDLSLGWSRPRGPRRKIILPDEGDDLIDKNKKDTLSEYIVLEKMILVDQFFGKDDKTIDLEKKSILSNEENGLNDLKNSSLKDFEVRPFLGKANDEMTMKTNSDEDRSLKETIPCLENDSMLVLSNQVDENNRLLQKMNDDLAIKAKCPHDMTKMSSNIVVEGDEQLRKLPVKSNARDCRSSQSEMPARPMNWMCWRGWFKISGRYYGPLFAHWSTKVGEKAWNATRSLPQIVELTMVSKSHAWPRSFEISPPTDDDIALFFFPPDSRVEKMVDLLLEEVIRCDLMLKVELDEAEMLIFPSALLPENYHRFQDKYYLWGVCKRKDSDSNTGEVIGIQQTHERSTEQIVPKPLNRSKELQRQMVNGNMILERDELQESLCHLGDEGGDEDMGGDCGKDEGLTGCLKLFPVQAENIALKLNMGDGGNEVDLELGLRPPFRR